MGDSGVGKSNLLLRYKSNNYDPFMKNTIGVDFFQIDRTVSGGLKVYEFIYIYLIYRPRFSFGILQVKKNLEV